MSRSDNLERLARLETGQLSDVLDEAGLPNCALSSALRPATSARRMVGIAVCARGEPLVYTRETRRKVFDVDALDKALGADTILMLDTGSFRDGSCLGGLMAYSFHRNGCRGVVVDGTIRDAAEIEELGMPIFCRGVTPVNGARRWGLTEIGGPISLPGSSSVRVSISPGDYVVADEDGVIVVPAQAIETVVVDTEELARIERKISEELRAGGDRGEVFKHNPRFDHVRSVV